MCSSCLNFEANNVSVFAYFLCRVFTCHMHQCLHSPLQAFSKHLVALSESTVICNYDISKLFYFTSFFSILSAMVLSVIPSRSWYSLWNLILGDSALSNIFTAANPSHFLSHVSNSYAVFIFLYRLVALRVFLYSLVFLFSHFSWALSFILDILNLVQIFSPE